MSAPTKVRASARVTVTIVIEGAGGCWGGDCSLAQVHDQAKVGALNTLRKGLGQLGWNIVGEPKVTAVLTEEER